MDTQQPTDIRWQQRFQNFRRAFALLREALEDKNINDYSDLEREGIIQRFEYTFELGWKTFKDYLEFNGINLLETTPRKVIKECAAVNIFGEAEINPEVFMERPVAHLRLRTIQASDC
jgi:nucleotidyltransferase substrate binding protein (TIGR01987 family)